MNSYLFYDIETTGLNKAFDQIVQFAAIRTDMLLNEIERHNFLVKLRPDVIISPHAIITHRISVSDAMCGICEFEAAAKIHKLINEPGTISLGYNTLGFDDEFLRFTFHRNLLPPYTHQYKNGCRRMDLFPIAIMYWLYRKNVLNWPENNGKPSLRLEHLSAANDLTRGKAHDALVDVEATIALTKRFIKETEMWNYLSGFFVKNIDRQRVSKLPVAFEQKTAGYTCGMMISGEFGTDMLFQIPVLFIGNSIPYSNQTLWLRTDLPELRDTALDTIPETTWVIRKRFGEPGILLPPLERYVTLLDKKRLLESEKNIKWLQKNPDIFISVIEYHQNFQYPEIPDLDVDAALYQLEFMSRNTEMLCRQFHLAPIPEKEKLIDQFQTPETRTLALRVLARNYPESLSAEHLQKFRKYMKKVNPPTPEKALCDYKGTLRTTPASALAEIKELKKSRDLERLQIHLLDELETYIIQTFQADF
ncbi:MAG: exonuclease domain-containing protein [Desulfobacterales bacterium]